ncbi:MAG: hypothetical protein ABEJ04_05505 [Halobacteriaceae archaeon]
MCDGDGSASEGQSRATSAGGSTPVPAELLEYLRDSIGVNLRAVAHYDRDSVTVEAGGPGDSRFAEEHLEEIVDDLRLQDVGQANQESLYDVGELYCTLRAFDDALVLHFIQDEQRGTLVSLEPETAPGITDFIYDVLHLLDEHSAQDISYAPDWETDA